MTALFKGSPSFAGRSDITRDSRVVVRGRCPPTRVRTLNTCGRLATDALRGPQPRTLGPRRPSPPGRGGPAVTRRVKGPTGPPNQRRSPSWAPLPLRLVAARGSHVESAFARGGVFPTASSHPHRERDGARAEAIRDI
ncbi:hypothetical protein GW17_00050663 [Ensete ventricosum]|nr:hypothetical protein GW17_00050663 [Ensete ventricosum]